MGVGDTVVELRVNRQRNKILFLHFFFEIIHLGIGRRGEAQWSQ